MPKIIVYDPIFNRRVIEVKVGLAALIRLRTDGWFTAYFSKKDNFVMYYFIAWCKKCGRYFLTDETYLGHVDQSELCPICHGKN
jgi:hypothetical protein